MNILTCNFGGYTYKQEWACNQVTKLESFIEPIRDGYQLTIKNACYCKIKREIGSLELVGGICEIEAKNPVLGDEPRTFDILPNSNLAYIRGDHEQHETPVPIYLESTLRYIDETGEHLICHL